MKVVSTNIGKRRTVQWNGKDVETGIYKYHVENGIFLMSEDVASDKVVDRKYHGGVDKACYAFGTASYPIWEKLFPNVAVEFGMFGENLTIEGLDEKAIKIGSVYQIGEAIVQVSQPRTPCFKLGIRFGDQTVLKYFIELAFSGIYLRVIRDGWVKKDDEVLLLNSFDFEPTVHDVHYRKFGNPSEELIAKVSNSKSLSESYLS